ncbi:MAG: hypothetical protein Q8Q52_01395 [Acidimicrobiia bacterium]|nr:hypothetical protein [Acidimicrobiia bacterium]
MTRTLPLFVAAVVIACGSPLTETSETVTATDPPATTQTTTAQSSSTSTTTTTTRTDADSTTVDHDAAADLVELGLAQGIPVDPPEGFPSIEELAEAMAYPFFRPPPHPRARIFSGYMTGADAEELAAAGYDPDLLQKEMTITYFDGITVWDYPGGFRQVATPDGVLLYQAEDGSWQESEGSEWSPLPIPMWPLAQDMVVGLLETDRAVTKGYETLADSETVHLRLIDNQTEVWLDEVGAVMRIVFDLSKPDKGLSLFMVWDVETLSPDLTGALPDLP